MDHKFLRISAADGIATVTLNRPPVNAVTVELRLEVIDAFDALSERADIRVIVLTGTGHVFSAGMDTKTTAPAPKPGEMTRNSRITTATSLAIRECSKPVIAAVNGPAIGTGFAMAAACDIMVAAAEAHFSMPETVFGYATGAAMLHSLFGRSKGRRLYYTGAKITAQEMHRLGLVEACVPREQVMAEAMQIAREIAVQSPLVIAKAKQAYNIVERSSYREGKAFEEAITPQLSQSEDHQEAKRAARERRRPNYTGR
jgi:enoyl-CoA hydratase